MIKVKSVNVEAAIPPQGSPTVHLPPRRYPLILRSLPAPSHSCHSLKPNRTTKFETKSPYPTSRRMRTCRFMQGGHESGRPHDTEPSCSNRIKPQIASRSVYITDRNALQSTVCSETTWIGRLSRFRGSRGWWSAGIMLGNVEDWDVAAVFSWD